MRYKVTWKQVSVMVDADTPAAAAQQADRTLSHNVTYVTELDSKNKPIGKPVEVRKNTVFRVT